ncbi:hypothetical protein [Azospirillum sp. ST 5-10]|uniref:hypothetical protein n=1 Tax=unclassified Azospirillum TaxID=2630922 RepID=UPI003F49D198
MAKDRITGIAFPLFWVFFGLFCADVLAGKLRVLTGGGGGSPLGDVGQFLMLACAAALLTVAALRRERMKLERDTASQETAAPDTPREKTAAPALGAGKTARSPVTKGGDHGWYGKAADRPRARRTRPHDRPPCRGRP